MQDASHLSDAALTTELSRLAAREREATAVLIVHLAEFDARRLYEGAGYPSMFQYCMTVLRLSEDAVYNRITAARAARRHPAIVDMLVSGALSPTTVRLLARHLTAENDRALLAAAAGKGKQAVEELLACRFPQADVPPRVRALPSRPAANASSLTAASTMPAATAAASVGGGGLLAEPFAGTPKDTSGECALAVAVPRPVVRPLAPERYEVRFTATAETREKLRRAQDLLGHAIPSGDIAQVVDRALTLLVADVERKKFAATPRPRPSRGQSKDSRNIPAEVQRAATARDDGRGRFVAKNGRRCEARRFLEFHHVTPYAVGGEPTVENIQLRCRAHNGYEAEKFYGPAVRRRRAEAVGEGAVRYGSVIEGATRSGTSEPSEAQGF